MRTWFRLPIPTVSCRKDRWICSYIADEGFYSVFKVFQTHKMSHVVNPGTERPGRTAPGSQIKGTVILFKAVGHLDPWRKADRQIPNAVFESLGGTVWQTTLSLFQTITYGSGIWQRHSPRIIGAEYSCLSWTQSQIWPLLFGDWALMRVLFIFYPELGHKDPWDSVT